MGRKSQRNGTVDAAEQSSALRERVQVWSVDLTVPIAAKVIRAQGIDGDQYDGRYAAGR
jgi:hypothetical protein